MGDLAPPLIICKDSANEGNENLFSYCRVQPILCKDNENKTHHKGSTPILFFAREQYINWWGQVPTYNVWKQKQYECPSKFDGLRSFFNEVPHAFHRFSTDYEDFDGLYNGKRPIMTESDRL